MRPTFSIIFFTVLSGAGYGLLFLVGLSLLYAPAVLSQLGGLDPQASFEALATRTRLAAELALVLGALLTIAGLLCSVGHLGKPLRAWRAFSQWRSSWLSREGVASVLTFVPTFGLLIAMWYGVDIRSNTAMIGAAALSCFCAITVFCTARIYSSLKPIRAWDNGYVVPGYLLLALYTGALWVSAIYTMPLSLSPLAIPIGTLYLVNAFVIAPLAVGLKVAYWRSLAEPARPDTGDATGLARLGSVRSFEQPHTEENYLTHEMGFVLARKHARRLRAIAAVLMVGAPFAIWPLSIVLGDFASWIVVLLGMLGVFFERWLFFAEARHGVIAYYGR
jgi:sulfite dehydrogenase (quinone) subunit SoeC